MKNTKELITNLISELKTKGHEWAECDIKENLILDEDGQKAELAKDITAMANNKNISYLLLGIEDKTFDISGIDLSNLNQARLNQIISDKIDPPIAVKFHSTTINSKPIGLITINGTDRPYLISRDLSYKKTDSKKVSIRAGSIFVRHQDITRGCTRIELDAIYQDKLPILKLHIQREKISAYEWKLKISIENTTAYSAKRFQLWFEFYSCELVMCPEFNHNHPIQQLNEDNQVHSVSWDISSLHGNCTTQEKELTLKIHKLEGNEISYGVIRSDIRGENITRVSDIHYLPKIDLPNEEDNPDLKRTWKKIMKKLKTPSNPSTN